MPRPGAPPGRGEHARGAGRRTRCGARSSSFFGTGPATASTSPTSTTSSRPRPLRRRPDRGARRHGSRDHRRATARAWARGGSCARGRSRRCSTGPPASRRSRTRSRPPGGADPETLDDARTSAPDTVRTLGRVVSLRDFEDAAPRVGARRQGARGHVWTPGRRRGRRPPHRRRRRTAPSSCRRPLARPARRPRRPPRPVPPARDRRLHADARAVSRRPSSRAIPTRCRRTCDAAARAALHALFAFESREFGQPVHPSDVFAALQSRPGVVGVDARRRSHRHATASRRRPTWRAGARPVAADELATLDEPATRGERAMTERRRAARASCPPSTALRDVERGEPLRRCSRWSRSRPAGQGRHRRALRRPLRRDVRADWVVPYIGDLVVNDPLHEAVVGRRADVGRTIFYRRRKGVAADARAARRAT